MSMEVYLPAHLGYNERPTDQPTNQPTNRPTDQQTDWSVDEQTGSKGGFTSNNYPIDFGDMNLQNCGFKSDIMS